LVSAKNLSLKTKHRSSVRYKRECKKSKNSKKQNVSKERKWHKKGLLKKRRKLTLRQLWPNNSNNNSNSKKSLILFPKYYNPLPSNR
jgi:hypothetical protein